MTLVRLELPILSLTPGLKQCCAARYLTILQRALNTMAPQAGFSSVMRVPGSRVLRAGSSVENLLFVGVWQKIVGVRKLCAQLVVSLPEDPNPPGVASRTEGTSSVDVQDAKPCRQ
jgi:hypothetical protein